MRSTGGSMNQHEVNTLAHDGPDKRLRRLLARRKRVLALLRAGRRDASGDSGYRSRYAASLWALAQAQTPAEDRVPEP